MYICIGDLTPHTTVGTGFTYFRGDINFSDILLFKSIEPTSQFVLPSKRLPFSYTPLSHLTNVRVYDYMKTPAIHLFWKYKLNTIKPSRIKRTKQAQVVIPTTLESACGSPTCVCVCVCVIERERERERGERDIKVV